MKRIQRRFAALIAVLCCLCVNSAMAEIYPGCVHHEHNAGCGGLQNLCAHICRTCVREIQQMVDELPAADRTIASSERTAVIAQMEEIDSRKALISDAARAEINFMLYELTALRLAPPYKGVAFLGIEKQCTGDVPPGVSAPIVSASSGYRGAVFYPFGEAQPVDTIMPKPNGPGAAACVSPGRYAMSESGYQHEGYLCETTLLINGAQANKAAGYEAIWNVPFAANQSYHVVFINHYTKLAGQPGAEVAADLPDTGDDSMPLLYSLIAVLCAAGAWALGRSRNKRK